MWDDKKSCSYLYVMTDSTTDVWGRLPRGQKLEEKKESTTDRGTYRRILESFRVSTNNKSKGVTIKKCSRVYLVWYLTIRNIFGHYFLINVQKTSSQLKWPILKINCQIKVASTIYLKKISLYVKVLLYEIVIQIIPYKFLTVQRPFAFIPTSSLDLIIYLVHTIDAVVRYPKPESEMPALWYLNPNPTLKNGTRTPTWQEFWLLLYTTFLIPGPDRTEPDFCSPTISLIPTVLMIYKKWALSSSLIPNETDRYNHSFVHLYFAIYAALNSYILDEFFFSHWVNICLYFPKVLFNFLCG